MADWQRQVSDFAHRRHLLYDPTVHALDVVSEAGEVAKEVLLAADYGRRVFQPRPELVDELGDLLYSVLALAEYAVQMLAKRWDALSVSMNIGS